MFSYLSCRARQKQPHSWYFRDVRKEIAQYIRECSIFSLHFQTAGWIGIYHTALTQHFPLFTLIRTAYSWLYLSQLPFKMFLFNDDKRSYNIFKITIFFALAPIWLPTWLYCDFHYAKNRPIWELENFSYLRKSYWKFDIKKETIWTWYGLNLHFHCTQLTLLGVKLCVNKLHPWQTSREPSKERSIFIKLW